MRDKLRILATLGLAFAIMPHDQTALGNEKPKLTLPPIEKPPSGTKEYFFNKNGEFSTERMLRTECVFKCFAINDKNAKRKFVKWQKLNIAP